MVNDMNRKFTLLWMAPLLLGFNAAWADDGLPDPAADEAHGNAQIAAAAAAELEIATVALPAEATIRLMGDADDEDSAAVTADIELPTLPDEGADGQRGLDTARSAFSAADNASQYGDDIAENGAENIENRGRAEDLPVDVPGRPDTPPSN